MSLSFWGGRDGAEHLLYVLQVQVEEIQRRSGYMTGGFGSYRRIPRNTEVVGDGKT